MRVGFARLSINSIFILLSIGTLEVASQTQQPKEPEMAVKIDTDLVVTDVQVMSKKTGLVVGDLKLEDFLLYEDNVRQEITQFSQDQLPLSIMLLLDVSGSVQPKLRQIQAGAKQAMEQLKPEDEVAVMVFAGGAKLIQDFTKNRQLIENKIAGIKDNNPLSFLERIGTRINEGVYQAAAHMEKGSNPLSRRVIIGVTDNKSSAIPTGHSGSEALEQLYESGSVVCGLIVDGDIFGLGKVANPFGSLLGNINPFADKTGGEVMKAKERSSRINWSSCWVIYVHAIRWDIYRPTLISMASFASLS
jgi:VWFA-related protein